MGISCIPINLCKCWAVEFRICPNTQLISDQIFQLLTGILILTCSLPSQVKFKYKCTIKNMERPYNDTFDANTFPA